MAVPRSDLPHRCWPPASLAGLTMAIAVTVAIAGCSSGTGAGSAPGAALTQIPVTSDSAPGTRSWAPWPQAQHDARHSGASDQAGPTAGKLVWKRSLAPSAAPAGPVVDANNTAYLSDAAGTLHAIDLRNGQDRWTAPASPVGGDLSIAPLVLPDGDVVAGESDGLSAWDGADGHPVWHVGLGGGTWTSPVTADGSRIWVGSGSGEVAAVAVEHHRASKVWAIKAAASSYGSVVTTGDGRIYTTSTTGLVAIDDHGASASVAWTRDPDDDIVEVSAGLSAGGIVVLGTNGHTEWAYNRAGAQVWTAPRGITYSSPSVTDDGLAYVAEKANRVNVFDISNGQRTGLYSTGVSPAGSRSEVWTSVVIDAHHDLYFGTRSKYLIGIRPDGTRMFSMPLGSSTSSYPALTGDGHLLIATDAGDLMYVR